MEEIRVQQPNEIVYVTGWELDEFDYPGTRDKGGVVSPSPAEFDFLISDYSYLFKLSEERYPEQYWVEIVAYYLGCLMGIKVPPAFAAYDSKSKNCGALIESFTSHRGVPASKRKNFYHGGDILKQLIKDYDLKKGEKHNLRTILGFSRFFLGTFETRKYPLEYWAKVFTFDSLLGNTDRHHDNWGIFYWIDEGGVRHCKFSPVYDNGTSMGYEVVEKNFSKYDDPKHLDKFYIDRIGKATHHMRPKLGEERMLHREFLKMYVGLDLSLKSMVLDCLRFDFPRLEEIIETLTQFDIPVPLSKKRAQFMLRLVKRRRTLLIEDMEAL